MVSQPPKTQNYFAPLLVIGILFSVFGFLTWVNSVLIAFFKQVFNLSTVASNLVAFAFLISYTVMAVPASIVLKRTGFKKGMSLGLLVMATGTVTFVPAVRVVSYPLFLIGLFVTGIGMTVLQTAANPYATILGPRESAAQRISFMGIANKLAGIASQYIFGGLLLTGAGTVTGAASLEKIVSPYLILTGLLVGLAGLIRFSNLPEVSEEQDDPSADVTAGTTDRSEHTSIWQFPNLVLGVITLFCYVGAEVIAGDTIINYGRALGFANDEAKYFTTYTLYGLLGGYLLGIILIPRFISQQAALRFGALYSLVLTIATLLTSGFRSVLCVALMGFGLAPIWPAIWPLALNRLGRFTKTGSALLIMGISGGALLPLLHGYLTDVVSPKLAYGLLLPLFGFILYYAIWGYKKTSW
ncbi:glucose/galactose MFS transporter [Spirosoma endbachense]|uniref:Glucose/galactose MFS transporter n=1 Tax=Spirosoma endbachense TaxID=2666025 RepID=A0A6P1W473_9BACT|nr:glucose/galactose MFS transporter [Spirosoma endbachense]QHW00262.1 glucose/galactose MFS transporter [Spirosoma endbachense]